MDDNALIDFQRLASILQNSYAHATDMDILCPSPLRNMKPTPYSNWAGYDTVAGKWSTKTHEFSGHVFPDYCLGFFYMLSPKLAGIIALKTGKLTSGRKMIRLEDTFLTGVVRSQITSPSTSRVLSLVENNPLAKIILDCPLMSGLKNILFNEVVVRKKTYLKLPGVWFYSKCFIEVYIVNPLNFLFSDLIPDNSRVMSIVKYLFKR